MNINLCPREGACVSPQTQPASQESSSNNRDEESEEVKVFLDPQESDYVYPQTQPANVENSSGLIQQSSGKLENTSDYTLPEEESIHLNRLGSEIP